MGWNAGALQAAAQTLAAEYPWVQIYKAAPNSAGTTNVSTAARVNASWVVSGGQLTAADLSFSGGEPNGPVWGFGFWSAQTGGVFGGSKQSATGSAGAFNSAGQVKISSLTSPGSSPA